MQLADILKFDPPFVVKKGSMRSWYVVGASQKIRDKRGLFSNQEDARKFADILNADYKPLEEFQKRLCQLLNRFDSDTDPKEIANAITFMDIS